MSDRQHWITGAYEPIESPDFVAEGEWVSFTYGPFPDQEACDKVANDDKAMLQAIGEKIASDFEVDCTDPITYSQACKHFEETIMSEHFAELLPETHQAHLAAANRQA